MKHGCTAVLGGNAPVDSRLPAGMFYALGVYVSDDGGEWLIRDYAGQSGRFCVIGPWTTDHLASFRTLADARAFIAERAGSGSWEEVSVSGTETGSEAR